MSNSPISDDPLLTEAAEWIWQTLQDEEGMLLGGELLELILATERELGIAHRDTAEIAQLLEDEFTMRGVQTSPNSLEAPLLKLVLDWETEFLGFAGIVRERIGRTTGAG